MLAVVVGGLLSTLFLQNLEAVELSLVLLPLWREHLWGGDELVRFLLELELLASEQLLLVLDDLHVFQVLLESELFFFLFFSLLGDQYLLLQDSLVLVVFLLVFAPLELLFESQNVHLQFKLKPIPVHSNDLFLRISGLLPLPASSGSLS